MIQYLLSLWLVNKLSLIYLMMLMVNGIMDSVLIQEISG